MEIVRPSNSTPLSEQQYSSALTICKWAADVIRDRDQYIADHKLDPAINNPSANWSKDSSVFTGYRTISSPDRINLNMLRVFTQTFTGNFLGVQHAAGMPIPTSVSSRLDDLVEQCLRDDPNPWWLQRYLRLVDHEPSLAGVSLPEAFGECGFRTKQDVIVNHDLFVYLERVALLKSTKTFRRLERSGWPFKRRPLLLEIGSGFGGLAYLLHKLVPRSTYICVDLPESLCFAALYLSRFFPKIHLANRQTNWSNLTDYDFVFVPNYMFHQLERSGLTVNLAINTLSMSEMTADQVVYYCAGIKRLIGRKGAFFEQNQDNRSQGLCFAGDLIKDQFETKQSVFLDGTDLTQGEASLWSMA